MPAALDRINRINRIFLGMIIQIFNRESYESSECRIDFKSVDKLGSNLRSYLLRIVNVE